MDFGFATRAAMIDADTQAVAVAQDYLVPWLFEALPKVYRLETIGRGTAARMLRRARAIIVDGGRVFDKALLADMPNLGLIACFNAGYDGIDPGWAREHGIRVTHAREVNHEDVADFAIGQIVNHYRILSGGDRWIRAGGWIAGGPRAPTRSLAGARLGIVGLGAIGKAVARRAQVMRMSPMWWGPRDKRVPWPRAASLIELARASDILVIAASASAGNRGLISTEVIDALGPRGLLVNVARGSLVDEAALIAALRSGALGAAALDVFEEEPIALDRWRDVPNVALTPHSAGVTDDALRRMADLVRANLDAFFSGAPLPTPIALPLVH